ncbi:pteridine reductase [Alteromonas pelagimontana]|uniref:Pteridine reductase n=1 Tax=Alteromonas pelagimontana TaxID=1858656 RepID=A0A6M4M9P8_9ALTE|nr:pteridine reductase [Alteromonas pelagimontana]QJR79528.1 pteridine reductase [Alteromonas pelagimontana]
MTSSAPVALITGAAKRIGAVLAEQLHSKGFCVIIHYHHSQTAAEALAHSLNQRRDNSAITLQADLCDLDAVNQLASDAQDAFGRIDLLVNNASAFYPTPMGSMTKQDWDILVGSNVQGALFLTQALAASLRAQNGSVVNMIDMHVDRPLPQHAIYCLAKSALVSVTRSLANELAPAIRVNGIAPGAILWPEKTLCEDEKNQMLASIPLNRLGSPDNIAHALTFLVEADYVTGQVLYVDGGRSIMSNASA